ncbi:GIY-YIG nuclease family protein [Parvibaculum sp.]|jgi:hypothetical protein|uniref:GIY-YIG nuclease family protein n=1 Tax=Parvibaculum sp. TaxID=2024848 RepID=UPI001B0F7717|nr:GIY-YIG nuclease family protein [Parvibaculum sp.]MBO6633784.1 GIY-YIG nuclease family protein [Parvibaculum sp.]MBO6677633.1 GIY-YIG nuclease family protein [Parvibaculum sp.]MBO6684483.1 GIY-YIG nuclease family protein [Parvibaculum sp.]
MDKSRRRQIVKDYKEREVARGIFAVRCLASGEVWLGVGRSLDNMRNGIWFTLRLGTHPCVTLQAAWNAHGEESFVYEVVEEVDAKDMTPWMLQSLLKERLQHWQAEWGAEAIRT